MNWDDLRIFLAVQRGRTLARASRALRVDATTVGRRLVALESGVGARLFDRTPEGYTLTRAGHDLLPHAIRMGDEALALERAVGGADARLSGPVRLSATEMLGTRFIVARLPEFVERYPDIALDLSCTNVPINLGRREADIALRLARPVEENLVVKRLARIDLALYAGTAYLAAASAPGSQAGSPTAPPSRSARSERSLAGLRAILFADSRAFAVENEWLAARLGGARVVMRSDSVSSIYSAAVAGVGIALLPRVVADLEPRLVRLKTHGAPEPRVVWQAIHRDLAKAPRIRVVCDFLARVFAVRGAPAGQAATSRA